ncbi:DNA helicase, partial [Tanacetum coccineum]
YVTSSVLFWLISSLVSCLHLLYPEFSPAYMDLGDCHCECRHCGGLFWYNERLKGRQYSRHPEYHLCCGGGKFYMHPTPDPPSFIQQLIGNSHFMENIRAYNQMFAMMSFGAKFDESHNGLVRQFKTARDRCNAGEIPGFKIRLYNLGGVRRYELPTSDVLRAIVFEDGPRSRTDFDVIIEFRELILKPRNGIGEGRKVTMNAYYKYQLHSRPKEFGLLFKSRWLFQQYVVTVFCAIEQSRLSCLYDAISRGERWGIMVGFIIILPSTFIGGPRYMYSHYLDALAICQSLRNPQFFITFTCNVKWPEIKRYASRYPGLTPADRADIVCRVFQQRVKDFVKFLKRSKNIWLRCCSSLYHRVPEKRFAPLSYAPVGDSKNKITDASQIDEYISAELPDPVKDPRGYKVVSELMLHGPCGAANLSAPCTQNGTYNKKFPKRFNANTFFDSNGHTQYRRRDTGTYFMKHESRLDNCNVVPYNRVLCLAFEAHINVEYYGWRYISKGPDRILANISRSIGEPSTSASANNKKIDEIQNYVDGRFICPYEACWRIFDFLIHSREPAVQILNVHLEDKQRVTFSERERLDTIVNVPERKKTTLTEWFVYNNENTDGRHLTYLNFPSEFVWYADSKQWKRRQIATKKSLGRLTYVHPSSGELFYFRMLLCHQKGCKSPTEVRTVNGKIFPTYRAACEALGLLGDDKEWDIALQESAFSATSSEIRTLFAQILIYCDVADPVKLWAKHWESMQDDIPMKISELTGIPNYHVNNPELQGYILYELEAILNGFGKCVRDFGLQPPPEHLLKDLKNKLLMEEKNYNRELLMQDAILSVPKLARDFL